MHVSDLVENTCFRKEDNGVCETKKSSCACEACCGVLHVAVHACGGMLSAGSCVQGSEKDYSVCEGEL